MNPANSGTYCLVLRVDLSRLIRVGRLGAAKFPSGYYVYVGSALNGLRQRIARHLSSEKSLHWHIDYLLQHAAIVGVRSTLSSMKLECLLSGRIREICREIPVKGFGSSDCRCPAHLFYFPHNPTTDPRFETLWSKKRKKGEFLLP